VRCHQLRFPSRQGSTSFEFAFLRSSLCLRVLVPGVGWVCFVGGFWRSRPSDRRFSAAGEFTGRRSFAGFLLLPLFLLRKRRLGGLGCWLASLTPTVSYSPGQGLSGCFCQVISGCSVSCFWSPWALDSPDPMFGSFYVEGKKFKFFWGWLRSFSFQID